MKSWVLSVDLKSDQRLAGAVESARGWLEDVLGVQSAPLVDAAWSLASVAGKEAVALKLSDWSFDQGVQAILDRSDLTSEIKARRKFHQVWGDLLQARNRQQLRELQELVAV